MSTKLHIFGTCAGTEPMPGRHHCSFAIEHNDQLYWFDAGETCSYTAYLMGIDPRKIHSIFISHPHLDHIGGLANLFGTMRKLDSRYGGMEGKSVRFFCPDQALWPAAKQFLALATGEFVTRFSIIEQLVCDGMLLTDDGITVEAMHNLHLPQAADGSWRSYSYRITVDDKTIVFSGDVKDYAEIEPLLRGADVILAETGHHRPVKVCRELNEMGIRPQTLLFIHHGRAILEEGDAAIEEAGLIYDGAIRVLNDGETIPLDALTPGAAAR